MRPEQRIRFLSAMRRFINDLRAMEAGERRGFRNGLRVKGVRGVPGLFEMTWAPEALSGDRDGQHSIRVNDRWRICFLWSGGNAYRVELVDYH